jgi:hypothetical protein
MKSDYLTNLLLEIKSDPSRGTLIPLGDTCKSVRILRYGRGDLIFYQDGDPALLFDSDAVYSKAVAKRSIKRWDNNDKVTEEELRDIIGRVVEM